MKALVVALFRSLVSTPGRCVGSFLTGHKDAITSAAALVSTAAIVFGAVQVLAGRKAVQAQALAAALKSSRSLMMQIEANPDVYASLVGQSKQTVVRSLFIEQVISMFSEQFMFENAGVLPTNYWAKFRKDLCDFTVLPGVAPIVEQNIKRRSYPEQFSAELVRCVQAK